MSKIINLQWEIKYINKVLLIKITINLKETNNNWFNSSKNDKNNIIQSNINEVENLNNFLILYLILNWYLKTFFQQFKLI